MSSNRAWLAAVGAAWVVGCTTVGPQDLRQAEAYRNLAAMHLERGHPGAAIRDYGKALKANDADAESHFGIGEAYRRKEEYALAEKHLKRALELDPELLDARLNLGALYVETERWEDAIRENRALIEDPTLIFPERALVNLGWAEYQAGRFEEAKEHLAEAVHSNPRSLQAQLNLGVVLFEEGEFVEAATALEAALEILNDRPKEMFSDIEAQTRFRLAQTYLKLGQRDRAVEHLRLSSERDDQGEWGRRSRAYLQVIQ